MEKIPISFAEIHRVEGFLRGIEIGKFIFQSVGLNLTQTSWLVEFRSVGCVHPGVERNFLSHLSRQLSEQYPEYSFVCSEERLTVYVVGRITRSASIDDLSPHADLCIEDDDCYASVSSNYCSIIRFGLEVYETGKSLMDDLTSLGQQCIIQDYGLDSIQYTNLALMFPDSVNSNVQNFNQWPTTKDNEHADCSTKLVKHLISELVLVLKEQTSVLARCIRDSQVKNNNSVRFGIGYTNSNNDKDSCSINNRYNNSNSKSEDDWIIEKNRSSKKHVFTIHSPSLEAEEIKLFSKKKRNAYYAMQRLKYKMLSGKKTCHDGVSAIDKVRVDKVDYSSVPPPEFNSNVIIRRIDKSKLTSDVLAALSVFSKCNKRSTRYHADAVREILRSGLPIEEFGLAKVLQSLSEMGFDEKMIQSHHTLRHLQRFSINSKIENPHRYCRQ